MAPGRDVTESDVAGGPGPLAGRRVTQLASLGPGPYAAMLLGDLGAAVTVVDRIEPALGVVPPASDPRRRGQASIAADLKHPAAREVVLRLIAGSDVFIEGMRPGVAERLGVGPDAALERNPRLVYVRVTGWGQEGPLAETAGHDINYLALSGLLHALGDPGGRPAVPLNIVGDYAAGGLYAAFGTLGALLERERTGAGQVIDAAIADGLASLAAATLGVLAAGRWGPRGTNDFDGSLPWYRTYRTRDGGFVAVGALEDRFYAALLGGLGLDPRAWPRDDPSLREPLAAELARRFGAADRDYWASRFAGAGACVTPVLRLDEVAGHPHHRSRATYLDGPGGPQPAPGPRYSRTRLPRPRPPAMPGEHTAVVLERLGYTSGEIAGLLRDGAVAAQAGLNSEHKGARACP